MTIQDIQSLAEAHGLLLTDKMNFNEMGIDFKVVFALDTKGQRHCCKVSDEAAFCLIQRPYISKTLLT
ncbi:hypothetical protein R7J54_19320, partial [Acinetobacter baumannii]|nr:hypothetical protein [Acinetobacter baumannii]